MKFIISDAVDRQLWLTLDPYGIYRQRKALGVQVWRGREWWMP